MTISRSPGTARTAGGITFYVMRSARKTLCLMVTPGGRVEARAPNTMPLAVIDAFVIRKAAWIKEKAAARKPVAAYDAQQERALRDKGASLLPPLIRQYGERMGAYPTRITITGAAKRFGSCSAKGALCFSFRLFAYPMDLIEYVVVHELAHLIHLNHSRDFHQAVAAVFPDWQARDARLKLPPEQLPSP